MHRHKSPASQKTPLSIINPSNNENDLKVAKKIVKSTVKRDISPSGHSSGRSDGTIIQKLNSARTKSSGHIHARAPSLEKNTTPQSREAKFKLATSKRPSKDGLTPTRNPQILRLEGIIKQKEEAQNQQSIDSPKKGKVLTDVCKAKEPQARKETLDIVSEENEDYGNQENKRGLNMKQVHKQRELQGNNQQGLLEASKRSEIEKILSLQNDIVTLQSSERENRSKSKEWKKQLEIETAISSRNNDENLFSPKKDGDVENQEDSGKMSSHVRGVFMKEHITNVERKKEHDQKRMLKEYLDFQLNEKKRIKEEERLRKEAQEKKEEERLKREIDQMNKQYEKESNVGKPKYEDIRIESPSKSSSKRKSVRRSTNLGVGKAVETEKEVSEESRYNLSSSRMSMRIESLAKKSIDELTGKESIRTGDILKLAEENQTLKNQNIRKNELIDMLLSALKNKDPVQETRHVHPLEIARGSSEKIGFSQIKGQEMTENNFARNQGLLRERVTNKSPSLYSTSNILKLETDDNDSRRDDLMNYTPINIQTQNNIHKASETLSKLIGPEIYNEFKLPRIMDPNPHRRGYSSPLDVNPIKGFTFLSKSNSQAAGGAGTNMVTTGDVGSAYQTGPINTPILRSSPRTFGINMYSPSAASVNTYKLRKDFVVNSVTPKQYGYQPIVYSRSRGLDESSEPDGRSLTKTYTELDSNRMPLSLSHLSQLSQRRGFDGSLLPVVQMPSSPFRGGQNYPRGFGETRSPIRVVDMASVQTASSNRTRDSGRESLDSRMERPQLYESKDIRVFSNKREKDASIRLPQSSINKLEELKFKLSIDSTFERTFEKATDKGDLEIESAGIKDSLQSTSVSRTRFPKEVFCLSLRKKGVI